MLLHNSFGWLYFDASPTLFGVSFFSAFISAVVVSFRRQWRYIVQCLTEMGICFVCVMFFIPVY